MPQHSAKDSKRWKVRHKIRGALNLAVVRGVPDHDGLWSLIAVIVKVVEHGNKRLRTLRRELGLAVNLREEPTAAAESFCPGTSRWLLGRRRRIEHDARIFETALFGLFVVGFTIKKKEKREAFYTIG